MATAEDAENQAQSSVAFPSSSNNHDRTSIYSVQSAHSAQSAQSGSQQQQYQPRTSSTSRSAQAQPLSLLYPPYLPFRRISLPSLPTAINPAVLQQQKQQQRDSIASFESLPEESSGTGSGDEGMGVTFVPKNQNHRAIAGKGKTKRPISIDGLSNASISMNRRIGPRRGAMSMHANSKLPSLPKLSKTSTPMLKDIPLDDPLLVKRRKVIKEFYETEKAYVDGLDLIYEHFLLPLLNSLTSDSNPLLDRAVLTTVFSNFIDIWNLHKAFLGELTVLFYPKEGSQARDTEMPPPSAVSPVQKAVDPAAEEHGFPLNPPPLSPILVAHFPYLSLYTPFITSFPTIISALNTLITPPPRWASSSSYSSPSKPAHKARTNSQDSSASSGSGSGAKFSYDKRFAEWVAKQEEDPRCGRLKLRDWMLTIVQRCPRYLLLLKDLIECTPGVNDEGGEEGGSKGKSEEGEEKWSREATKEEERERKQLQNVHGLVSKITLSLNTSLQVHSQTLSLLALQRATPNFPFQLIEPGRTLLRRGPLIQIEQSSPPRDREFLLFSDCLIWLVGEEAEKKEKEWGLNLTDFDLDGGIEAAKEGLSALWSTFGLSSGAMSSNMTLGVEKDEKPKFAVVRTSTRDVMIGDGVPDSPANPVPPKLRRPAVVRTRSKSEGEVAMMQNKIQVRAQAQTQAATPSNALDESPGDGEEPGVNVEDDAFQSSSHADSEDADASASPRSKGIPTHKSNFARINKGSHLHLHLNKHKGGSKRYTTSPRSSPSHPRHHSASAYPYARSRHFNMRSRPSARSSTSTSRRNTTVGGEERWVYKGRIELVDLEVVVPPDLGVENSNDEEGGEGEDGLGWRWEILSPDGSFVLYAASARERTEWTSLIRQAKSQILVSLNAQNPNSTLTSSAATQHLRKSLQALPFRPGDVRMQDDTDTDEEEAEEEDGEKKNRHSVASADSGNGGSIENVRDDTGGAHISKSSKDKGKKSKSASKKQKKQKFASYKERRSRVEHWVPAIWIPDEKAEGCMRCGKAFGWRRRRHHCRLCGRCVCAECSERTFFISDPNAKDPATSSKAARACNECYETVFPLIESPGNVQEAEAVADDSTVRARPRPSHLPFSDPTSASSSAVSLGGTGASGRLSTALYTDTITSLTDLPAWMSMSVPSLPFSSPSSSAVRVSGKGKEKERELSGPAALMAIDRKRYSYGREKDDKRRLSVHSGNSGGGGKERFSRDSGVVFDLDESGDEYGYERTWVDEDEDGGGIGTPRREERDARDPRESRVKMRSPSSRSRSYYQILEDFNSVATEASATDVDTSMEEQQFLQSRFNVSSPLEEMIESEEEEGEGQEGGEDSSAFSASSVTSSTKRHTLHSHSSPASSSISLSTSLPRPPPSFYRKGPLSGVQVSERKEDTIRRHKRFSLPAVALQTTSVLTRTQSTTHGLDVGRENSGGSVAFPGNGRGSGEGISGLCAAGRSGASKLSPGAGSHLQGMPYRTKKFTSVLGERHEYGYGHRHHQSAHPSSVNHAHGRSQMVGERGGADSHVQEATDLRRGVAAGKLSELLGRNRG